MRLLVPALTLGVLTACGNECRFLERCDGDVLQVCGEGVDQVVGREIHDYPCEGDNSTCVEVGSYAHCVVDPAEECDPDAYAASCDGDLLTHCPDSVGYVQVEDCSSLNRSCVDGECVSG